MPAPLRGNRVGHQLIETVGDLGNRQMGLRSLTEAIDTASAGGIPVFHVFGAPAEFERTLIGERIRAGLEAARGRVGGRPPALRGDDLAAARAMLRDPAITVEAVARRLGVAPSTLYRHLPGGRSGMAVSDIALAATTRGEARRRQRVPGDPPDPSSQRDHPHR